MHHAQARLLGRGQQGQVGRVARARRHAQGGGHEAVRRRAQEGDEGEPGQRD